MTTMVQTARPGDWIEVDAPGTTPRRRGLVLEVVGGPGHERYRVRWDEEHESIFYPSHSARVTRGRAPRPARRRRP